MHDRADLYGAAFPAPQMKISNDTLGVWSITQGVVAFCCAPFKEVERAVGVEKTTALGEMGDVFAGWVRAVREAQVRTGKDSSEDHTVRNMYSALTGHPSPPHSTDLDTFARCLHTLQSHPSNAHHHISPSAADDAKALDFMVTCCNRLAAGKRSLFVTRDGKLGSGPCGMAVGDRVSLLRGVAVPMVLRCVGAEGGRFEVVGPSFLSGEGVVDVEGFNRVDFGCDWESVCLV